jgi:hypothetical protein
LSLAVFCSACVVKPCSCFSEPRVVRVQIRGQGRQGGLQSQLVQLQLRHVVCAHLRYERSCFTTIDFWGLLTSTSSPRVCATGKGKKSRQVVFWWTTRGVLVASDALDGTRVCCRSMAISSDHLWDSAIQARSIGRTLAFSKRLMRSLLRRSKLATGPTSAIRYSYSRSVSICAQCELLVFVLQHLPPVLVEGALLINGRCRLLDLAAFCCLSDSASSFLQIAWEASLLSIPTPARR